MDQPRPETAGATCPFADTARAQPPRPAPRPAHVSLVDWLRYFRRDILSAQPERLYRARMAEFRTPFFRSFLCNDPDLVDLVLSGRPEDFPKSTRLFEGLAPLLGHSIFLTNGEEWRRQRRIVDPAFESGRLREIFPAMWDATRAAVDRLAAVADGRPFDAEPHTGHFALDVIFRALFSIPVEDATAQDIFTAFREHQRSRPLVNAGSLMGLPRWAPRLHGRRTRATAARIRKAIRTLVDQRVAQIAAGTAPDDLATRLMTTPDPVTGTLFSPEDMVDQVGIFVLAGHETSASALAWGLWLCARFPDWQDRVADEARAVIDPETIYFSNVSKLKLTRATFNETMRLYPPVPMLLREAAKDERFRGREVPAGSQVVISQWHLHRHERMWPDPHGFYPERWLSDEGRAPARHAFYPFSAGLRVCPGSAFAMTEGVLALAMILRHYRVETVPGHDPVPVAQLTVRGRDGIRLRLTPRET
ncbi:MAG: cytochrome P450 [Rubellimicrobium sp.]|nr:cytochrome P450 [Rubellimicrobium sp.]